MFTATTLRKLWPHARAELIEAIVTQAPTIFPKYGITEPLTVAHAMAQFSEECGADTDGVENMNYTAQGLINTWPSRFNAATARYYAHNQKKIANKVYGGRMGNAADNDDGYNYRGHGGSQITGRDNYEKVGAQVGLDLVGSPDLANSPEHWLEVSCQDFINCACLPFAKRDDVTGVTHHLNGGLIGLASRKEWLAKWKAALAAEGKALPVAAARSPSVLAMGDQGWEVKAAQERLNDLNYSVGKADGDFGTGTKHAVLAFQSDQGLPTTGELDQATRAEMATAPPKPVAEKRAVATEADVREAGDDDDVTHGDNVGRLGKLGVGFGALEAINKSGAIDALKDTTDQVSTLRSTIDSAQDSMQWFTSHWWIGAIVVGGIGWYFGRKIIKRKIARYRAGHATEL